MAPEPRQQAHHHIPASAKTVHWGYFSRLLPPVVTIESGDFVTIEALTHHAYDDHARMIHGDPGAESVFHWTKEGKNVDRRGAGPIDASLHGRGAGEGLGVHICTGPVAVRGAEPGDVLELRILDVRPRACANPAYPGRTFGSNAAANWGFHYKDLLTEPKPREVITIYEIDAAGDHNWARAVYNFRWVPQTDPFGVRHEIIDYPGVPVNHTLVTENHGILKDVRIPIRPHFGVIALAPREADIVGSTPPGYFGGNIDDWRIGKGATMYYPVAVAGALLSVGDPHASQGDSELCGTAIECSLTGTFQLVLHKRDTLAGTALADLEYPLLERSDEWVVHGFSYANYLAELGEEAQTEIFAKSSLDGAMRDAFRKMRHFLMTAKGLSEDEAISLMSVAVDFGVTQVVDANWGVHAVLKKAIFGAAAAEFGDDAMTAYPRDLIGYAATPPQAQWPGDARIAVQFVINYEEGGENAIFHGDPAAEAFLTELIGAQPVPGMRNMNIESMFEYGSRAGFWRLHRAFTERGVPVTVYGIAMALERNPAAVAGMLAADWEIATHGYRWIDYQYVPESVEREHIATAIDIHTRVTGSRPLGWYQGRCSPNTARLVVEEGGFLYNADSYADDLPYWDNSYGKPQLIVPYAFDSNDMRFASPQGFNSGDQFFAYLRDTFDVLYREGDTLPRMMSIGLHCRLAGRPGRTAALERFIDYAAGHERVWFARRIDIARHWISTHPFAA